MYEEGNGVPQDYTEALKWYQKAADQGDAIGQATLGLMYEKGNGVPPDYVLAHKWFNLAATRLSSSGSEKEERDTVVTERDRVEGLMTPEQIAEAQKLAREWKSTP